MYINFFNKLKWEKPQVSMISDDSAAEFAIYHRYAADEFNKGGIEVVNQILLPRAEYLHQGYSKVTQSLHEVIFLSSLVVARK